MPAFDFCLLSRAINSKAHSLAGVHACCMHRLIKESRSREKKFIVIFYFVSNFISKPSHESRVVRYKDIMAHTALAWLCTGKSKVKVWCYASRKASKCDCASILMGKYVKNT